MQNARSWKVRECCTPGDRERLCRFRYAEYVNKKGLFRDTADHDANLLSDAVDEFGINFLAESAGEVIGSIRLNSFRDFVQTFCLKEFRILDVDPNVLNEGCIVTRAIVHLDWRKSPVFPDLSLAAAKRMRDDGLRWMFVDTATSRKAGEEDRFLSLYRSMGFRVWLDSADVPGIGPGAVMVFDLHAAMQDPRSLARLYLSQNEPIPAPAA